jgi:hypothetical protein
MLRIVSAVAVGLMLTAGVYADDEVAQANTTDNRLSEKLSELEGKVNGIEESYLETKTTVGKLAKLKISGYMQAQFAIAETLGVQTSVAGAKFDKGTDSRFFIRRGRLKFTYDNGLSQYVLQFDGSHSGFEIKDAYVAITEPWLKYFTGTMGIFDRPFGYEISYSSSMRESPERSRIYQTLFPKERETGAKLAFAADEGWLSHFNLKGGFFNGLTPLQLENDNTKDFIGRAGFEAPFRDFGMAIDGGFSSYYSWQGVTNTDTTGGGGIAYDMDGSVFKKLTNQKGQKFDRQYFGFDLQYYYDIPVIGGLTFRGEYLWGMQPGTSSSSSFYQPSAGQAPNGSLYERNFAGYYLYWVQCWGSRVQSVVKYDVYDPNVDVGGDDIGASNSYTTATDLNYATVGLGLIYHWDDNVKFMLYYDMPKNEESQKLTSTDPYKDFSRDLPDNVLTFRVQYKF